MQRYAYDHATQSLSPLMPGEVGKNAQGKDAPRNQWVRYDDVKKAGPYLKNMVDEAYGKGLQHGNEQAHMAASAPTKDKRTEQLLNELYHDRARLERVVKSAVDTMKLVITALNESLDDKKEYDTGMMENHAGALAQFVELHADT
jgi:hypothetical protein